MRLDRFVVLVALLLQGTEAAIGTMTQRGDGLYNYDLGMATLYYLSDSPTTVALPKRLRVYGVRITYVSGSGTSDRAYPQGTLGDSKWGSWVTVYLNGAPASLLVPVPSDSGIQLLDYSPPYAAYMSRSVNLASATAYELRCPARWLAKGSSVSIWNGDPGRGDNIGSVVINWYLIVKVDTHTHTWTPSTSSPLTPSSTPSSSLSLSVSRSSTLSRMSTSISASPQKASSTFLLTESRHTPSSTLHPRRMRRTVSPTTWNIVQPPSAEPIATTKSSHNTGSADSGTQDVINVVGSGSAAVAGTLLPTAANKPTVVSRTADARSCIALTGDINTFPTPSSSSMLPAVVVPGRTTAGGMVLSTLTLLAVALLWNLVLSDGVVCILPCINPRH